MDRIEASIQVALDYYKAENLNAAIDCLQETADEISLLIDTRDEKE